MTPEISSAGFPHVGSANDEQAESYNHHQQALTSHSNMSLISLHNASRDVCYFVYGDSDASFDTVERFYEPNAGVSRPKAPQYVKLTWIIV
jgi:hypothetical protein